MTDWYEQADRYLLGTYDRIPLHFERGEGVYLYDGAGNRYLDALAGIAVNLLGYRHPKLVEAGRRAVNDVHHVSNLFQVRPQFELAKKLNQTGFTGAAFFGNSGAEAIEAAIKYARKWSYRRGDEASTILSFENSFHGRTLGALAATGQTKYQEGFGPLPGGFEHVPYNDREALEERMGPDVCGVLLEPLQGEGGVIPADPEFLNGVRDLCDRFEALMMLDEIQTGMGRTGEYFAYQHVGVQPDLVSLAKGLAGGFPMGALLVDESVRGALQPGDHASTFGGNPFVSRMACTVLDAIESEGLLANARDRGEQVKEGLEDLSGRFGPVESPRGRGLMLGLPLDSSLNAADLMHDLREEGLILGTAGTNALRIVPPLILSESEAGDLLDRLESGLTRAVPG